MQAPVRVIVSSAQLIFTVESGSVDDVIFCIVKLISFQLQYKMLQAMLSPEVTTIKAGDIIKNVVTQFSLQIVEILKVPPYLSLFGNLVSNSFHQTFNISNIHTDMLMY